MAQNAPGVVRQGFYARRMARPLRIEFEGAVYHVTSRGDRRESIFIDSEDRLGLLTVVAEAMRRFDAEILAYCLMGNHYHFVVHTRQANLSRLMRHVNGVYTRAFNQRHGLVGHLFQGRFKSIHVDRDAYLMELCRYVELNPVRAKMIASPAEWPWSSYRAHAGIEPSPDWLDTEGLHEYMLGREVRNVDDRRIAVQRYEELVASGLGVPLWEVALRQQTYLGDEAFIERLQNRIDAQRLNCSEIPVAHRKRMKTLAQWLDTDGSRGDGMRRAYIEGGWTMSAIAEQSRLSVSRVSRLIKGAERGAKGKT